MCSFFRDSSTDKKAIIANGLTVKSNMNINIKLHTRHYYVLVQNLEIYKLYIIIIYNILYYIMKSVLL